MFEIVGHLVRRIKKGIAVQNISTRNMQRNPNVYISPNVKIDIHNLYLKNNCYLKIMEGSIIEARIVFEREGAKIQIGSNTFIGSSNLISADSITIGNNVLMAWGCYVVDHNSHSLIFKERSNDVRNWYKGEKDWTTVLKKPVVIKDKAWIGFNSIILKGVTIGEGSIIGAGSVVTKDIPDWSVATGNPAIVLKSIPENERA
jgi:acetyltransferase-like isoleucine patch superfamily enzyme